MPAPYYSVGSNHKFRTNPLRKDGAVYDLTGAAVVLILTDPNGVVTNHNATLDDAANGVASYTTLAGDLTGPGTWDRQWKVTLAGVVLKGKPISFKVGV